MKKIIAVILIAVLLIAFAGCNAQVGIGSFTFNGAHLQIHDKCVDVEVKSWRGDEESGVELKLVNGETIFASEGTYIMYEKDCPLCKGNNP